jgi:hypothetical protein
MDANTERKLSKWGFRVYFTMVVLGMAYFVWGLMTNTGLATWLNKLQMDMSPDRSYSPVLTMVLLVLPVQVVAFPAGFLFDYLTDQGIFTPVAQHPPERERA